MTPAFRKNGETGGTHTQNGSGIFFDHAAGGLILTKSNDLLFQFR
jgi:hypothetical protein